MAQLESGEMVGEPCNEETPQYELNLYWKQGEDFGEYLCGSESISEALVKWADYFKSCRERCLALADKFKGKDIDAVANANTISFFGDQSVLEGAVNEKLLDLFVVEPCSGPKNRP